MHLFPSIDEAPHGGLDYQSIEYRWLVIQWALELTDAPLGQYDVSPIYGPPPHPEWEELAYSPVDVMALELWYNSEHAVSAY